ncbi:MAG: response regulator [Gloeomargarita sp. HHBFW_bins_162]
MGTSATNTSILVIDDDPITLSLLQKYLTYQGYDVSTFAEPEAALHALQEKSWDLVLLDWLLPGMTGLQLLHKLRQFYPPGVLPVIMITAREASVDMVTALRAGANDYITKPLNLPVVEARIQSQLATVRSIQIPSNSSLLGGRYQVQRLLGEGGFGRTYLAQDLHRPGAPLCVVKKLLSVAPKEPEKLLRARHLFHREAQALETLGHYKYIPRLLAYFEQNGEFYLVEEYIEGQSLKEQFLAGKDWSLLEIFSFLKNLLKTLKFIHRHQVIHRDIKPDNIIYCPTRGDYILIDFGAVKKVVAESDPELATLSIGTRGYAPIEQLMGFPEWNSDVYAVGMVTMQALTGLPPTDLPWNHHTGELDLTPWRTPKNSHLLNILQGMTRYYSQDRYPSAAAVLKDLGKLEPILMRLME